MSNKKRPPQSLHEEFGPAALPLLSGIIAEQAEKTPLPRRFDTTHNARPTVTIRDTYTGREYECGLFAYVALREALTALFPDEENF